MFIEIDKHIDGRWYAQLYNHPGRLHAAFAYDKDLSYDGARNKLEDFYQETFMSYKSMTKYGMLTLAYALIDYIYKNPLCRDELEWNDYHDFPIAEAPKDWYKPVKKALGVKSKEYTLQIGKCNEDYNGDHHYHKKGHQLVIILGPKTGYMEPRGKVYIGDKILPAVEGEAYYFPTGVTHGFRGSFFFVNLQNPPLIDEEGVDDYHTYN